MRILRNRFFIRAGLVVFATSPALSYALDAPFVAAFAKLNFSIRCVNWLEETPTACKRLSHGMVEALDFESNDKTQSLAFFKSRLLSYSKDERVLQLLKRFDFELQMLEQGMRTRVDLYTITKEYFLKNEPHLDSDRETHYLIAALFQDNARKYHIQWMRENSQKYGISSEFTALLDRILKRLSDSETNTLFFNRVELYPPEVEALRQDFNRKIYYYYMPWVLSRELETKMTEYDLSKTRLSDYRKLAQALPLMMSLIYKYHHYYKHETNSLSVLGWKTFMEKPEASGELQSTSSRGKISIRLKNHQGSPDLGWFYRYRDLYMAYLGSKNHSPGHGSLHSLMSYSDFELEIALKPTQTIRQVYDRAE